MVSTDSSSLFLQSPYSSFDGEEEERKEFLKDYNGYCDTKETPVQSDMDYKEGPLFFACNYYFHQIPIIDLDEHNELIIIYASNRKSKLSEIKKFLFSKKDLDIGTIIKCTKEGHRGKKYEYYCQKCDKHLCQNCRKKHPGNHKIIDFTIEFRKTSNLKEKIKEKIGDEKINPNLKILIESICRSFEEYPYHYYYFKNIKVIYDYLKTIGVIEDNNDWKKYLVKIVTKYLSCTSILLFSLLLGTFPILRILIFKIIIKVLSK